MIARIEATTLPFALPIADGRHLILPRLGSSYSTGLLGARRAEAPDVSLA
jgi:hypothetical protein